MEQENYTQRYLTMHFCRNLQKQQNSILHIEHTSPKVICRCVLTTSKGVVKNAAKEPETAPQKKLIMKDVSVLFSLLSNSPFKYSYPVQ